MRKENTFVKKCPSNKRHVEEIYSSFHGHVNQGLFSICDYWRDTSSNERIGVQIWIPTGNNVHKEIEINVSECRMFLEVRIPMTKFATDPSLAFKGILEKN